MRLALAALLALVALGCSDPEEPPVDASMRIDAPGVVQDCDEVAFAPEGTPCLFRGECTERIGCCTDTHRCVDGVVQRERQCEDDCLRSCGEALERGRPGDACDGAWFCSAFSDDLCCSIDVECRAGRLGVAEDCTPGCR